MEIARNGVAWVSLSGGQFASFDRRKCEGAAERAKGDGQSLSRRLDHVSLPGPQFTNENAPGSAESSYYAWVDQQNTFGLGNDVPIATGNACALLALKDGKFVTLRVPYPMGFGARGA